MDIKITLDISDRFDSALMRIASAIQAITVQTAPAPIASPIACKIHIPEKAPNSSVETPEPLDVPKPAEPPKSEPDAKTEAPAAANDETPVETPKPKRSHHKKVEPPKPEPEKSAEPAPVEAPAAEPEAETDAAPEMTLDEIRSVCVKAAKAGKTKIITDYLAAHNAESLSKLDPKFYPELSKIVEAAL